MENMTYIPLKDFIECLQSFEKQFGGDLPVLMADKDSIKALSPVADSFVMEIVHNQTNEKQNVVLITNFVTDDIDSSIKGMSV